MNILKLTGGARREPRVCNEHGEYQSLEMPRSDHWSRCPVCYERERAQRERDAAATAVAACGVVGLPRRFAGKTFDDFQVETDAHGHALGFARDYARDFNPDTSPCSIFLGGIGTAKTTLAAAMAAEIVAKGHAVLYIGARALFRRLKDTWSTAATETEGQALAALIKPDLLVIDEIGVQFGSETEQMFLYDVINGRYENCRPTLLISNLKLEGEIEGEKSVRGCLGERSFDRLREGGGQVVPFDWESWRGRAGGGS